MSVSRKEDLSEQIAGGDALVVVGAGVSVGATGAAPAATWTGLLLLGVDRVEELASPSDGWAERRRGDIASGRTSEMISAADGVTDELGGRQGGKYRRWLEDSVGALEVQDPAVLEAIARLGLPIATTN